MKAVELSDPAAGVLAWRKGQYELLLLKAAGLNSIMRLPRRLFFRVWLNTHLFNRKLKYLHFGASHLAT